MMRQIKAVLFFTVWDCFLWSVYNGHLLTEKVWILFHKQRIYEEFYIGGTYFNAGSYLLVCTIIIVIAAEYCLKSEGIQILVRCQNREQFVHMRWRVLLKVGAFYTGVHFFLGYLFSIVVFGASFVHTDSTVIFYIVSATALLLFLARVGMVYTLLRDVFQKKVLAMSGILGIYIGEYFIGYWILSDVWMPCKDLSLGVFAYFNGFGAAEFLSMLMRQIGLTAFTALLSKYRFMKKDVMQFEI